MSKPEFTISKETIEVMRIVRALSKSIKKGAIEFGTCWIICNDGTWKKTKKP